MRLTSTTVHGLPDLASYPRRDWAKRSVKRGVYAARRKALMDALARHAPHLELRGLAAGFHVLVLLPEGLTEEEVVSAARERSVGVYGLGDDAFGERRWPPALVMGFGNLGEGAIEHGIEALAGLLRG